MTRTIEEHWQLIDDVLRKRERSRAHGGQLQESVAGLLASAEGRESIRRRLAGKGVAFEGKYKFANEVFRALENGGAALTEMSANDRLKVQEAIIEHTRPRVDQAHWNMLWLLQREGHLRAGQMVLESLAKVSKRGDDFRRTLPALQAWQRFPPDRIVSLLDAAKRACKNAELSSRIESVLPWAANLRSKENESDPRSHRATVGASCDSGTVSGAEICPHEPLESATALAATVGGDGATAPVASKTAPPWPSESPEQTLADLCKGIQDLFKREQQNSSKLRQEQSELRDELARVHADLRIQSELTGDYVDRVRSLEQAQSESACELSAVRRDLKQLEQELAAARQERELARRRADDYIHDATLARDSAVRGFQANLWDRLRPCLVEVIDDVPQAGLSPDQMFFRHRLQEIRDMLRELGVPPD